MKATEFVKKYGLKHAKYISDKWGVSHKSFDTGNYHTTYYLDDIGDTSLDDLKTLVNAYELVEVGLPELKKAMFSDSKDLDYVKNWVLTVSEKLLTEKGIKLKQAIKLVESVND